MSAKSSTGPDAWAENWEEQADKLVADTPPPPAEKKVSSKVTKAQRRAQQAEFNRQLWAEAESPQTFHFLEARSDVPLRQEFKPAVTVLSRNPQIATRGSRLNGTTAGMSRLGLNDDDSEDDGRAALPSAEERQAMALRNLEDRQRKYDEVRERLFGSPSAPTSGASSPRSATPPKPYEGRGKGRGRGNGRDNSSNSSKRDSSTASGKSGQLYDPDSPRTNTGYNSRREKQPAGRTNTDGTQSPRQPIRSPRGPDSSGRGGFRGGFRGGRGG